MYDKKLFKDHLHLLEIGMSQFYVFFIEEVDKENIENGRNSRVPAKSPSKRVLTTNLQSRNVLSYFELLYSIRKNLSFILSSFLSLSPYHPFSFFM